MMQTQLDSLIARYQMWMDDSSERRNACQKSKDNYTYQYYAGRCDAFLAAINWLKGLRAQNGSERANETT